MFNVTIAIGYGASKTQGPLNYDQRAEFRQTVYNACKYLGTLQAVIDGPSYSPGWGQENSTWFAVSDVSPYQLSKITATLKELAGAFGQDAIALTVGTTLLIGKDSDV